MVVSLLGKVIPTPLKRKLQQVRNNYYGKSLKRIFLHEVLPRPLRNTLVKNYYNVKKESIIKQWESEGKPLPPPHVVKQQIIQDYQEKSSHQVFIETGTYLGDMLMAQTKKFKKLYSIEIDETLQKEAVKRFSSLANVKILLGDSGQVLPKITNNLDEPAIFWLDGHYSSGLTGTGNLECPIYKEIDSIFDNSPLNHILLIDDARLFVGERDYPTVEELTIYVQQKNPAYKVKVESDVIRYEIA